MASMVWEGSLVFEVEDSVMESNHVLAWSLRMTTLQEGWGIRSISLPPHLVHVDAGVAGLDASQLRFLCSGTGDGMGIL